MILEKKNDLICKQNIQLKLENFKNNSKQILIFEQDGILWMDIQKKLESNGYAVHRAQALLKKNILDYISFRNAVLRVFALPNENVPHLVICDTDTSQKKELEKFKKTMQKKETPNNFHYFRN